MVDWSERGHVLATCDEKVVYCKVVGLGNMNNCAPFQALANSKRSRGYHQFVLDFSSCQGMDSTFLGILVGLSLGDEKQQMEVSILNANASILRTLREVGIDRLLTVCKRSVTLPTFPMHRLEDTDVDPEQRVQMILEAHECLCEVEPDNQKRFGRFITMLRQELENAESPSKEKTTRSKASKTTSNSRSAPKQ